VVEDGGLGRSCSRSVVMARDRVQELGENRRIEIARTLLRHPQPEVHVPEQAALLGLAEGGSASELSDAPDVVKQRCRQQEVVTEARMQLCRLAAQRGDADGVLEEAARIAVVAVAARGGQGAERVPDTHVGDERIDNRRQPLVRDLGREELEEAVELVRIASKRRSQRRGVGLLGLLDRSHLDLELPAEALDAAEHVYGVALSEPLVEEVDVVPHTRLDAPARIGELEREVRSAVTGPPSLLLRDREHALHGPVLGELGDSRHASSLWRSGVGTLAAMADAQPFRAVRYAGAAGPLADLVAPPYDAVDDAERAELYTRSPYNVAHVTLPESAEGAARLYREWLASGILEEDDQPGAWMAVERYVGPDGVPRERHGLITSIAAEPYESGTVLPHERTHARVRDERLALLRSTRVQPEPILLLTDASIALETSSLPPEVEVAGTRLWRVEAPERIPGQLLIADGHHRYEAAVELARETGEETRIMVLVVAKDDTGLHVFPTHRVFANRPDLEALREGEAYGELDDALRTLDAEPYGRPAVIAYRRDHVEVIRGPEGELDTELVDRHGLGGIRYTPRLDDAVEAVDDGAANVAFLLREPRVDDVFAVAQRGERMPQKSTYFFPKPLSGLVFHPLDR
jgi:uncharacterized protein (DUF1015 family)